MYGASRLGWNAGRRPRTIQPDPRPLRWRMRRTEDGCDEGCRRVRIAVREHRRHRSCDRRRHRTGRSSAVHGRGLPRRDRGRRPHRGGRPGARIPAPVGQATGGGPRGSGSSAVAAGPLAPVDALVARRAARGTRLLRRIRDTHLVVARWSHVRDRSRLERAGCLSVGKAQRFIVKGNYGPLRDGELDRARLWGAELAKTIE